MTGAELLQEHRECGHDQLSISDLYLADRIDSALRQYGEQVKEKCVDICYQRNDYHATYCGCKIRELKL